MPPVIDRDEVVQLMRFVAEKAKKANGPMSVRGLCKEFGKETRSPVSLQGLERRIQNNRDRIHDMDEFDMETKVRMLMAVGARVDSAFLRELQKEADVEVDDQHRIIRYKKKMRSDGPSTSSSAKRRRDSETDTSEGRKMARTAAEVSEDDDEAKSVGEGTSNLGGHNIHQENNEETPRHSEIDQKPVDLFHHIPSGENGGYHYEDRQQHVPEDHEILVEQLSEDRARGEPSTSVRDLLILLRGTLMSLESSHLNGLRRKVEAKIQKLSNGKDLEFPLKTINMAFDPCLFLLIRHATSNPEEESTSLRSFLHFLRNSTCHLIHSSMAPFHEKMITYLEEFNAHDQRISIKIVHNAIDAILNFIDP